MKTICFFSGDITRAGGTERVSTMIANKLVYEKETRILFLSLVEQSRTLFFPLNKAIKHYVLGKKWINPGLGYLKIIPKLRQFLRQQSVDIIIDIDIVLDILSIPAAKGLKTKIISWEHFNYEYEKMSFYRYSILKYSVKRTDYIITLTESDKRAYQEKLNRKKNISAIYNPMIELSKLSKIDKTDKTKTKEKWLVTIGHLIKRKGMDYLAKTASLVLKKHRNWKWIVIGEGEERFFLEQIIEKEKLQEQLILTGQIKNVNFYLERAQIYVMTSRIEGFPMCLLEAKAFHLPSVSFCIKTGPDEIIENGKNGYLIPAFDCKKMAEKIEFLIENEPLRKEFSENTWNNISKFQMNIILNAWNKVLGTVYKEIK